MPEDALIALYLYLYLSLARLVLLTCLTPQQGVNLLLFGYQLPLQRFHELWCRSQGIETGFEAFGHASHPASVRCSK